MKILIPMAGEGSRFKNEGYLESKPAIKTYYRKTGELFPMVVCAVLDLPNVYNGGDNIIFVERDFHRENGTECEIKKHFKNAKFISVNNLTDGQASTCLLAREYINNDDELLIAGCDNGMEYDNKRFIEEKSKTDVLVFTYKHNEAILDNPNAYGYVVTDKNSTIVRDVSVKKIISNNPIEDNAIVATFWFRRGSIFVESAEKMIKENDRVNNEFYVDKVIKHALLLGYRVNIFEIDRYICWGTPKDYELYQKTFEYWMNFYNKEMDFFNK